MESEDIDLAVSRLIAALLAECGTVVLSRYDDEYAVETLQMGRRRRGVAVTLLGALEQAAGTRQLYPCRSCGNPRPLDQFPRDPSYVSGHRTICRACDRPRFRKYNRGGRKKPA